METRQLIILVVALVLAVGVRVLRKYLPGKSEIGKKGGQSNKEKIKGDEEDDYEPYSGK